MKHTAPIYVFMVYEYDFFSGDYEKTWRPEVKSYKPEDSDRLVFVSETTITVEVPEEFNPIPAQVAALEREKLAALAAYQKSVADINERLSKLLAITNDA